MLGKLSPEEEVEVERYAEQYPEIRQELQAIEETLEQYALLYGKTPPPGVLTAILQRLQERSNPPVKPSGNNRALAWMLALLLVAALTGWYFSYRSGLEKKSELATARDDLQALEENCDSLQQAYDRLSDDMEYLLDPNTRDILLNGTELQPDAIAYVLYNPERRAAYLKSLSLPDPPSDKQYQLWAIVDGAPVSMGVFDTPTDTAGLQEVPYVKNAQAYAVTLEPRGGSETPTMEQMYVMGEL